MLNRVILMGRITQDLELKQTQGGASVLSFSVAVDRSFVKQGEERQTDFIDCVAWRQQAEFISKYFGKGRMIALEGNLRKRVWEDKNGTKHYVTEVFVDSVSFTGEPKQGGNQGGYQQGGYQTGYQQGGYPQNAYQQAQPPQNSYQQSSQQQGGYQQTAPQQQGGYQQPTLGVPDMMEDYQVLDDDGVPF